MVDSDLEVMEGHELGECDVNKSVLAGAVLEKVAVISSLLHNLGVKSIDLLPVLGTRGVLVDEVQERRLLALLRLELVEENGTEEGGDGKDGTGLKSCQYTLT